MTNFRYHWRKGRKNGYPVCCILRFSWDITHGNVIGPGRIGEEHGGYAACGVFHGSRKRTRRRPLVCHHQWSSHHPIVVTGAEGAGQLRYCDKCEHAKWVQKGPLPSYEWGFMMMAESEQGGEWKHGASDHFISTEKDRAHQKKARKERRKLWRPFNRLLRRSPDPNEQSDD